MNNLEQLLVQLKSQPEIIKNFISNIDLQEIITYDTRQSKLKTFASTLPIIVKSLEEELFLSCYQDNWSTLVNLSQMILTAYEEGKYKVFEKTVSEYLSLIERDDSYSFEHSVTSILNCKYNLMRISRDAFPKKINYESIAASCKSIANNFNAKCKNSKKRKILERALIDFQYGCALIHADTEGFKNLEKSYPKYQLRHISFLILKKQAIHNTQHPELMNYMLDKGYIEKDFISDIKQHSAAYVCSYLEGYYFIEDIKKHEPLEIMRRQFTSFYTNFYKEIKDSNIAENCYNGHYHASFSGECINLIKAANSPQYFPIVKDFFESAKFIKIYSKQWPKIQSLNEDEVKLSLSIYYSLTNSKYSKNYTPSMSEYISNLKTECISNIKGVKETALCLLSNASLDNKEVSIDKFILNLALKNDTQKNKPLKL